MVNCWIFWCQHSMYFSQNVIKIGGWSAKMACTRGDPKKTGFSLKNKIYLHFKQKTLNPLQNNLHWRQYTCPIFFPTVWSISGTAEAWCCWVPPAKLFSPPPWWQISFLSMSFSLSKITRNHRELVPVNRVGWDQRSIPERPNTWSQTKLCELGHCHDGETNHPICHNTGRFLCTFSLNRFKTSWLTVCPGGTNSRCTIPQT